MWTSQLGPAAASVGLLCLVAVLFAKTEAFQQQQQQQQAVSLATLKQQVQLKTQQQVQQEQVSQAMQLQQQQQQQQQQQANQQTPAKQTSAKPNHRLVSKIKDARHRRRNRHQRHRQQQQLKQQQQQQQQSTLSEKSSLIESPNSSLMALESIVEEVARAGQLQAPMSAAVVPAPAPSQQQQVATREPAPMQSSPAVSATEILLDGSSSPILHLQQAPASQQQVQVPPASSLTPVSGNRAPGYNSRGFFLTSMLSKIMNVLNVTEFALEMRDGISSRASCMACNAVVGLFMSPLYSKDVFSAAIRTVCTSFKIQPARVCTGLVDSFQDDFEFIRKNTKLTRDEICAVVFGVDCARRQTYNLFWTVPIPDGPPNRPLQTGTIEVQPGQSVSSQPTGLPSSLSGLNEQGLGNMEDAPDLFEYQKSSIVASLAQSQSKSDQSPVQTAAQQVSTSRPMQDHLAHHHHHQLATASSSLQSLKAKTGKSLARPQYIFDDELAAGNDQTRQNGQQDKISSFVHITDIHIDPYYEPGSLNDCNEPLCCRASSGPVPIGDKRRQAGRWGDYGNCDTPVRTLRSALNRIREQHANAEYWLWTGDISPHDIWNISKSEASNHVRLVSKMVREHSNGLPVFPVIGNHEAHPVNSFSPPEIKGKFSMSWLYDLLADEWSDWLPKDALDTLRIGGYYKLLVRKGFRIIALNTNYCARLNPWSFYDPVDPANQLKWLVDELLEAELNQDKVHIIGHVPPDNRECTQAWLFNFINIVDRFKDTIEAQFYGHTHRDEWRIIYSLKRQDSPIGIQYIGPSITPFTENNPAYRIYHQDKFGHLIDSETYYFNLTEANETPDNEPIWRFSYRARTHLNMTQGLSAAEWHQYLQKLHDDDGLFDSFFKNYYRSSDVKSGQVCKAKCKFQMLSDLRLSHPYKTKPKPFLSNRKTSNHHRDRHHHDHHHHHHHKRHRHSDR